MGMLICYNAQQRENEVCNFQENGVAILWKNDLQLLGKMSCKKNLNERAAEG